MSKSYTPPRPEEIKSYLSQRGFDFKEFAGNNLKLKNCPLCRHQDSFSINHVSGQFFCWFAECNQKGNWVTLRRMLGDAIPCDKSVISWKQDWEDFFGIQNRGLVTRNKYPEVLSYLHKRGFSNETLDAFEVTNKNADSVRFPMYAWEHGKWIMVNARIIKVLGDKKNYFDMSGGPTHLLMGNHLLKYSKDETIYIFEGQWDMLTAYELGMRNVCSLPNGASSVKKEMLQWIPPNWKICLCVDMDDSGDACANKFLEIFGARVSRIHLPKKDLNEWFMEQPDITIKDVLARRSANIRQRKNTYRKIRRNISESEKQKPIVSTPFKSLNEQMGGGFFPAQMTSILAASGAGKTTLVNQIAVHIANQGVKVGLISLEGSEEELEIKIDRTITGIVGKDGSDETILENLLISNLKGKYVQHDTIINECLTMVCDDQCKVIIVDNLDYITGGTDPRKYETTAALMNMTDQEKVHLIQLWQCSKFDPTTVVNSGKQKGESRILQDSHNFMNLNKRKPDGKVLEMEKCRNEGPGEKPINLDYDKKTNIYIEVFGETDGNGKKHRLSLV